MILFVFFFSPALKGGKKQGYDLYFGFMRGSDSVCFFLFPGPKGRKKTGVLKGVFGLDVVMGCVIGLLFLFSS